MDLKMDFLKQTAGIIFFSNFFSSLETEELGKIKELKVGYDIIKQWGI